jgi:hypothetical protein
VLEKVFDKNSIYLPTKKIGKNNPKTAIFLQNLIQEKDMPPKPTLNIDMAEFRHMRSLMIKVQDKAVKIKNLQDKVLPQLKQQLADTKGAFQRQRTKSARGKNQRNQSGDCR